MPFIAEHNIDILTYNYTLFFLFFKYFIKIYHLDIMPIASSINAAIVPAA